MRRTARQARHPGTSSSDGESLLGTGAEDKTRILTNARCALAAAEPASWLTLGSIPQLYEIK